MALRVNALVAPRPPWGGGLWRCAPEGVTIYAATAKSVDVLEDGLARDGPELARDAGVGSAVLRAMGEAGLIEGVVLAPPPPFAAPDPAYPGPVSSEAQEFAAVALRQAVGDRVFSATLLSRG